MQPPRHEQPLKIVDFYILKQTVRALRANRLNSPIINAIKMECVFRFVIFIFYIFISVPTHHAPAPLVLWLCQYIRYAYIMMRYLIYMKETRIER